MNNVKNIVVPMDFSEEAMKGLEVALLFTQQQQVTVEMVYVSKSSSDYGKHSVEEEKHFAEKKFKTLIEKYASKVGNGSTLDYIFKRGKIYREVIEQAESMKDSLIVISTHGHSGFQEFFIGSNTFKIISATETPVLSIAKGQCPDKVSKIVMPIDATPKSRQKISYTAEIARLFGAEVCVLGVTSYHTEDIEEKISKYSAQACAYLTSLKIPNSQEYLYGDNVTDVTIDYANSIDAQMISIMSDHNTGFNLFMGSYAHQMINKAPEMVLCIPPKIGGEPTGFSTFGG